MTAITIHRCDFSSQVKDHDAEYHIQITLHGKGGMERETPMDRLDSCDSHLSRLVHSLYLNDEVKTVTITRFRPVDRSARVNGAAKRKECPLCGEPQANLSSHTQRAHGRKLSEIREEQASA